MAAPAAVRGGAGPGTGPWQPVNVDSQHCPARPLGIPEHIGENTEGTRLDSAPDLVAGRRSQGQTPALRITSRAVEQCASGVGDGRADTSFVKADVAAGVPAGTARPHGSAATAAIDLYWRATWLIERQLQLAGGEFVALLALEVPCSIRPTSYRSCSGQGIPTVRALRQQARGPP